MHLPSLLAVIFLAGQAIAYCQCLVSQFVNYGGSCYTCDLNGSGCVCYGGSGYASICNQMAMTCVQTGMISSNGCGATDIIICMDAVQSQPKATTAPQVAISSSAAVRGSSSTASTAVSIARPQSSGASVASVGSASVGSASSTTATSTSPTAKSLGNIMTLDRSHAIFGVFVPLVAVMLW